MTRAVGVNPERNERALPSRAASAVVQQFFERVAAGDAAGAAELWDLPALILGDEHVHGPLAKTPLERLFMDAAASAPPAKLGATDGPTQIPPSAAADARGLRVEWVSERVARVDAEWPERRLAGFLAGVDATSFLVRLDEYAQPKIRALVLCTGPGAVPAGGER